jgi:translation initiation factor IF-3
LSRPFPSRSSSSSVSFIRVNGKIRAREVRVIGVDGKQLGVLGLGEALNQARANGVDLVEIAPNAAPPVCRLVDYGKFRYEQAKKDKESKKHQHATRVKEVQLSPKIDPHDLTVKIEHAVDFLCEDMKVKVSLKFRGREMAHTEFGFQVIQKFLAEIAPFGHEDFEPKLIGRGINVMISPLPRNKRARNPRQFEGGNGAASNPPRHENNSHSQFESVEKPEKLKVSPSAEPNESKAGNFSNNPFAQMEINR